MIDDCVAIATRGEIFDGVFGSNVIYETALTSQRVNNKFHKAGSCKHCLSEDKREAEREWNSLYIREVHFLLYTKKSRASRC